MKTKPCEIGVLARCKDCGIEFEDYMTAKNLALKHARKFKHLVDLEITIVFEYDFREKEKR